MITKAEKEGVALGGADVLFAANLISVKWSDSPNSDVCI